MDGWKLSGERKESQPKWCEVGWKVSQGEGGWECRNGCETVEEEAIEVGEYLKGLMTGMKWNQLRNGELSFFFRVVWKSFLIFLWLYILCIEWSSDLALSKHSPTSSYFFFFFIEFLLLSSGYVLLTFRISISLRFSFCMNCGCKCMRGVEIWGKYVTVYGMYFFL